MTNKIELAKLPNDKVRSALIDIITNKLNLSNYEISIESGSSKGDNYIGVVYRATITSLDDGIDNNCDNGKISIIIKVPPENETRREQFFARPCFIRESLAYDEILPLLMEFQMSKGIEPTENGFHEFAECYGTLTEDKFEAIFMRDLKMDNFEMFSRFEKITYEHVDVVMKILGKLHAISFAMKDQCPEKLVEYQKLEDVIAQREDPNMELWMNSLIDRSYEALCEKNDKEILERIKKFYSKMKLWDTFKDLVKSSEPYTVFCHGDCWNNNILFKQENGKAVDARLIDWQILRYASPVCDLMYYIFACTNKELRDQHYSQLMTTYHTTLSNFLRKLGSDPEKLFPRSAFDDQLKKFGSFGLIMATMLLPIFSTKAEDIPDLDDMSEKLKEGNVDITDTFNASSTMDIYKLKMRDVIVDMCNLGYI